MCVIEYVYTTYNIRVLESKSILCKRKDEEVGGSEIELSSLSSPNKRVFVFPKPEVVIHAECDSERNIPLNSIYSNYIHPLQAYNMGKEEGRLPGTELNSRPRSPNKRVFVFHSPDVDVAHTEHDTGRQLSLTTAVYMSCTFITWGRKRECCLEPS
ncbi:hypothetical protein J6590_069946 [Homalodisca vitripennis]|nr:hypothetical protein J6590_069946 [Homalodisca vitripennis]